MIRWSAVSSKKSSIILVMGMVLVFWGVGNFTSSEEKAKDDDSELEEAALNALLSMFCPFPTSWCRWCSSTHHHCQNA